MYLAFTSKQSGRFRSLLTATCVPLVKRLKSDVGDSGRYSYLCALCVKRLKSNVGDAGLCSYLCTHCIKRLKSKVGDYLPLLLSYYSSTKPLSTFGIPFSQRRGINEDKIE